MKIELVLLNKIIYHSWNLFSLTACECLSSILKKKKKIYKFEKIKVMNRICRFDVERKNDGERIRTKNCSMLLKWTEDKFPFSGSCLKLEIFHIGQLCYLFDTLCVSLPACGYLKIWMLNNLQERPKHHNSSIGLRFISFHLDRSFEHNQKGHIYSRFFTNISFSSAFLWPKVQ